MYLPQWIRVIQENTRKRHDAFENCFVNLKPLRPLVDDLAHWQDKTVPELEEMVKGLRQGHLVLLVDKMSYLATLRHMGTIENLIYTPQVHTQQRELDGALEAFEFMIEITNEVIEFLNEHKDTCLIPAAFGGKR